jgi:5-methylcytosine-specific restriction endonuclease McrA
MSNPGIYASEEWRALRRRVLYEEPICSGCKMERSLHVDHIVAHKGRQDLFWDRANLQALCARCHNSKTCKQDGGFGRKPSGRPLLGTEVDGSPIDKNHPWNR